MRVTDAPQERGLGVPNSMRVCHCLGVFALLLSCLAAWPAGAQQNVLVNGSFDEDVLGWAPVENYMSVSFDADDVDGDMESGSAVVTFNDTIEGDVGSVAQCIQVRPGQVYTGTASYRIAPGQMRVGTAEMRFAWYTSSDCSGFSSATGFGNTGGVVGPWTDLAAAQFVAPSDAFSADVQLRIDKPQFGGVLAISFDALPEPSAALAAVTAMLTLLGLRRARS